MTLEYANEGSKDEPFIQDINEILQQSEIEQENTIRRKDKSMYIGSHDVGLGIGNNISISV